MAKARKKAAPKKKVAKNTARLAKAGKSDKSRRAGKATKRAPAKKKMTRAKSVKKAAPRKTASAKAKSKSSPARPSSKAAGAKKTTRTLAPVKHAPIRKRRVAEGPKLSDTLSRADRLTPAERVYEPMPPMQTDTPIRKDDMRPMPWFDRPGSTIPGAEE